MIRPAHPLVGSALLGATALLLVQAAPAQAQRAFCPTVVAGTAGTPDQAGFALDNGACTNGTIGAFSGAALGSQALSNLSQTSTQETSRATTDAIGARRNAEAQRDRSPAARQGSREPDSSQRAAERGQREGGRDRTTAERGERSPATRGRERDAARSPSSRRGAAAGPRARADGSAEPRARGPAAAPEREEAAPSRRARRPMRRSWSGAGRPAGPRRSRGRSPSSPSRLPAPPGS